MSSIHNHDRTPPDTTDQMPEVIRSEEELVIRLQPIESQRIRLVKRIVTETVTKTVEVRREELHIERLPATDTTPADNAPQPPTAGQPQPARLATRLRDGLSTLKQRSSNRATEPAAPTPFAGEDTEIVLMEEEVVVTKRIVPREKVRLRRQTVVDQHEIADSLRKEQVELIEEPTAIESTRDSANRADR